MSIKHSKSCSYVVFLMYFSHKWNEDNLWYTFFLLFNYVSSFLLAQLWSWKVSQDLHRCLQATFLVDLWQSILWTMAGSPCICVHSIHKYCFLKICDRHLIFGSRKKKTSCPLNEGPTVFSPSHQIVLTYLPVKC